MWDFLSVCGYIYIQIKTPSSSTAEESLVRTIFDSFLLILNHFNFWLVALTLYCCRFDLQISFHILKTDLTVWANYLLWISESTEQCFKHTDDVNVLKLHGPINNPNEVIYQNTDMFLKSRDNDLLC